MGIFKEEVRFLEDISMRQKRIFADACDYGVTADEIDMDRMRAVIMELIALPGSKVLWKSDGPVTQRTFRLIVMWGRLCEGVYEATKFNINYYRDKKREFFSIVQNAVRTNENGQELKF